MQASYNVQINVSVSDTWNEAFIVEQPRQRQRQKQAHKETNHNCVFRQDIVQPLRIFYWGHIECQSIDPAPPVASSSNSLYWSPMRKQRSELGIMQKNGTVVVSRRDAIGRFSNYCTYSVPVHVQRTGRQLYSFFPHRQCGAHPKEWKM